VHPERTRPNSGALARLKVRIENLERCIAETYQKPGHDGICDFEPDANLICQMLEKIPQAAMKRGDDLEHGVMAGD
jgi:hypothetical protein